MENADLITTIGVSLILLAFVLLTWKKIMAGGVAYNLLNLFGAGFACWGAYLINSKPFIILETVWIMVALYGLLKSFKTN